MSSNVRRAFAILEFIAGRPAGANLLDVAGALGLPASAAHRHLVELVDMGYVRQDGRQGAYAASTKLVSLGFAILAERGIVDLAQPILDRLARQSGELVRLAVADADRLTFVARAQGARGGLIYDGDMGREPVLFASATGLAWLSQASEDDAVARIVRQGLGPPGPLAPNTPVTMADVLRRVAQARRDGYGAVVDSASPGTSAIAVPVLGDGDVLGTISIAGPSVRFTPERMQAMVAPLREATAELSRTRLGSPALTSRQGWILADDPRLPERTPPTRDAGPTRRPRRPE